jgi:microcystin-dependent protein
VAVEPYIGEIRMFAFDYPPNGWARADGTLLPVRQFQVLHNVIGNQFGGDGTTNFALPDLRGQVPINQGTLHFCIAVQGDYPQQV